MEQICLPLLVSGQMSGRKLVRVYELIIEDTKNRSIYRNLLIDSIPIPIKDKNSLKSFNSPYSYPYLNTFPSLTTLL